ncbi:hypothetical protein [Streptomyces sp. JHA26]|uniref:hypothetical protein n=1 Tax=Streptomyces sp. JHA26 TaxID=1917143 RepID=UPI00098BB127|nr:hypothetical protein [Streptomyces sp. JHA26]
MTDIESVLGQVVPAVGAAVAVYGADVLRRAEDEAAGETVRLGRRLLGRILDRTARRAPIEEAVTDLAESPDEDALAVLRAQLRKALKDDSSLLAEVAALLPPAPDVRAGGRRGIAVGGDVNGILSTGDGATIVQGR